MKATGVFIFVIVCFLGLSLVCESARKNGGSLIERLSDVKEIKKLLRTRKNVLIIYAKSEKEISKKLKMFDEVATEMKGLATVALVDCSADKKTCKKYKASPASYDLKHYKDGEFHKDYDRQETVKSMSSFLRDPSGDIPWDEDPTADDVKHIEDKTQLTKLLTKEKKPMLIMFYAPWCGFCKKIKPDYSAAATELKGEAVMAGMDVDKSHNMAVRQEYNITGFPTMLYFERGQVKYKYGGENTKDGLVNWMRDPQPPKEPEKEQSWADEESDVVHLTDTDFDEYVAAHNSVLVMFYAPWCGHCKKMKPEYTEAAERMKEDDIEGTLAAVDATIAKGLAEKYKVKGFPTVKYFKDGEEAFDFNERGSEAIVDFMADPQEPPPPPPPEQPWSEVESEVIHLSDDTYKQALKKKKHSLVMFYAPWCGHCKNAKPEYMNAAAKFADDNKVAFMAADCTTERSLCEINDVTGYPTFKYFNYGKDGQKYTGGREEADFVNFMRDPQNPLASAPPPPPSPDQMWSDIDGNDNLHHLSETTFDGFLKDHPSVLVMFYAPWCGHCKNMKPAYGEAANKLVEDNIVGELATVDATAEAGVARRYEVKGYPSIKYFKNGKFEFDYDMARSTDALVSFMKNPVKPVPPPPEEKWSDTPSEVKHIDDKTFDKTLSDNENLLVMFYAPWCGHCKKAKPDYQEAAAELKGSGKTLAALDCTATGNFCSEQGVKGFPTINSYVGGKFVEKYPGGRTKDAFVSYMKTLGASEKTEQKKTEL